ncbi:MAG: DUF2334 domain-containing protein [Pseudonocardiaceae bacterium]|nr:DUF2334 domain-containing protein [Pseudonocardiaceae bacterium]
MLVSLSGITPRALSRCTDLAEELDRRGVPLSLLVNPSGQRSTAALDWVRQRARMDSVLLHGYKHEHQGTWRRRPEFAVLPAHEAGLRLTAALATMDGLGLRVDGFVPPRWQASRGTLLALHQHGVSLCAELSAIRDVRSDEVYRARVHGFGAGERAEPWWCLAVVLGAARAARRGSLVRIAVDGGYLVRQGVRQALLDAVDIALHHGAVGNTYPEVLERPGAERHSPGYRTERADRTERSPVHSAAGSSRGSTRTSVPSGARLVNIP